MSRWGNWLKRSTLVMLGVVLIGSPAGISARAAEPAETGEPVESTETVGNEADTGNEESSSSGTGTTLFITNFAPLDQGVRVQELEEGQDPNLPDRLDVSVAVKELTEEDVNAAQGAGISNIVRTVGEVSQLPVSNITVKDVTWEVTSTSESNNHTTYTYMPEIPSTDRFGNTLEVMNAMTQLPVIQASFAAAPAAEENPADEKNTVSSGSDMVSYADIDVGKWYSTGNGVTIYGQENSFIWDTDARRFRIEKEGNYLVTGTFQLDDPDQKGSADPLIEINQPGNYNIILQNLNVDLRTSVYSMLFSVPQGAVVNLATAADAGKKITLINHEGGYRRIIANNGTLNMSEVALECTGEIENKGTMAVQGASDFVVNGPVINGGTLTISQSSKMGTFDFTNDGTLEIGGKWEEHGSTSLSTLTTQGRFRNNGGKSVTINEGGLYVNEGQTPNDDGTIDWLIDNNGKLELLNGGSAEAKNIQNKNGGSITVRGNGSVLKAAGTKNGTVESGILTNEGEITLDDFGCAEAGSLQNTNRLSIGSDPKSPCILTINNSGDCSNTGTIEIEAKSQLNQKAGANVTLANDNSLTIKDKDCLGTGSGQITLSNPTGTGTFILAGLDRGMLHLPDNFAGLKYDGQNHTQEIVGVGGSVDSEAVTDDEEENTEDTNNKDGIIRIDKEWKYDKGDVVFEIRVKAELSQISLERAERPADTANGGWKPGVEGVSTDPTITKITVRDIKDPGTYELVYSNMDQKNKDQICIVPVFEMEEWSMAINTNKGDDDQAKGIWGAEKSAVYENKEEISGTIQVAIFNEKSGSGTVTLYWNAYDRDQPKVSTTRSKEFPVTLKPDGTATLNFSIPTADQNYILKPMLEMDAQGDPIVTDDENYAYNHPYQLTAVYKNNADQVYYASGDPAEDHKKVGIDKNLEGWYADKKLIVKRRISTLNFTSNYYSLPHVYDGEALQMPVKSTDIMLGNTNREEPDYDWYKGTEAAVKEAYEKKTTADIAGLELITGKLAEQELAAPRDAGWYIIEAKLPSTSEYMGSKQVQLIRIEPKNVTIAVKDQHKTYGADDPSSWRGFVIDPESEESNELYVIDGLVARDNKMIKGDIARQDDDGEECGRYEIKIETYDADGKDPRRDNYRFTQRSGYLTIDQRELDWDTTKVFMVITEDNTISVVGGLKTEYHLNEGEDKETIEKNLADDDVIVVYDKLDLSEDKTKVTIDKPRLSGTASANYVIQGKSIPVNSDVYKVSVKPGSVDATTLNKLKDSGYDTETQVISEMESYLVGQGVPKENIALYDILLTNADGSELTDEQIRDFPWGALTVTVPYPSGTSRRTSFMAAHMFTEDIALDGPGMKKGNVETKNWSEVATMEEGVRFQVTSLSPIAIGWAKADPTSPTNPDNPDDPNNPNNPDDPNNPNNPDDPSNPNNPNDPNNGNNGTNNGNNNGTNSGNNNNNGTSGTNNNNSGTGNNSTGTTNNTNKTGTGTTTTKTTSAKTGDTAQIAFYMIATLVACLLLILIIVLIRMQFRKKD